MSKPLPIRLRTSPSSGDAGQPWEPAAEPSAAAILIVEDVEALRECVAEYFLMVGYEVVSAGNAHEAITAIESGRRVDLVFTDVDMPGPMDGLGLAQWLSVNRPKWPVVVTSGKPCPQPGGGTAYRQFVPKPYALDTLERDLQSLIAGSTRAVN